MSLLELIRRVPGKKSVTVCRFFGGHAELDLQDEFIDAKRHQIQRFEAVAADALRGGGSLMMIARHKRKAVCYWVRLGSGNWESYRDAPHMTRLKNSTNKYHGDLRAFA